MTIMLHEISHTDELSFYILRSIHNQNDSFYPLNGYISHLLKDKKNTLLKSLLSLPKEQFKFQSDHCFSLLTSSEKNLALEFRQDLTSDFSSNDEIFIYYGSSLSLFENVFTDILPSDFHDLYHYMIQNNLIKKIGTNLGKAHLFSSVISDHDFSDFIAAPLFQNYSDAMKAMMKDFNLLKEDRSYLLSVIDSQKEIIAVLNQKIQDLNYRNYISSTHTWA